VKVTGFNVNEAEPSDNPVKDLILKVKSH